MQAKSIAQNGYKIRLSSFEEIADGAQRVLNICPYECRVQHGASVGGVAFHPTEGWLVLVNKNRC